MSTPQLVLCYDSFSGSSGANLTSRASDLRDMWTRFDGFDPSGGAHYYRGLSDPVTISGNACHTPSTVGEYIYGMVVASFPDDLTIEGTVSVPPSGRMNGLIIRGQEWTSTGYIFGINSDGAWLSVLQQDTVVTYNSTAYGSVIVAPNVRLKVKITGMQIAGYVDGVQVLNFDLASDPTGINQYTHNLRLGFYLTQSSSLSDFVIHTLPSFSTLPLQNTTVTSQGLTGTVQRVGVPELAETVVAVDRVSNAVVGTATSNTTTGEFTIVLSPAVDPGNLLVFVVDQYTGPELYPRAYDKLTADSVSAPYLTQVADITAIDSGASNFSTHLPGVDIVYTITPALPFTDSHPNSGLFNPPFWSDDYVVAISNSDPQSTNYYNVIGGAPIPTPEGGQYHRMLSNVMVHKARSSIGDTVLIAPIAGQRVITEQEMKPSMSTGYYPTSQSYLVEAYALINGNYLSAWANVSSNEAAFNEKLNEVSMLIVGSSVNSSSYTVADVVFGVRYIRSGSDVLAQVISNGVVQVSETTAFSADQFWLFNTVGTLYLAGPGQDTGVAFTDPSQLNNWPISATIPFGPDFSTQRIHFTGSYNPNHVKYVSIFDFGNMTYVDPTSLVGIGFEWDIVSNQGQLLIT